MLRTKGLPQLVLLMMLSVVRTGSAQTAAVGPAALAHQCLRGDTVEWCRLALPACKQYVESRAQSPAANPQEPEDDKIWNQMAGCELKLGQYADAAQHYEQTLKLRQKQYPGAHVLLASVHHDLGTAYSAQEKYAEAEAQFRRALSMRQHLLGAEHADTQASLRAMGRSLYLQEKHSEAAPVFEQIRNITERLFGSDDLRTATALREVGMVWSNIEGKRIDAQRVLRRALMIQKVKLGTEHMDLVETMRALAHNLENTSQDSEAESLYRTALTILERVYGPDSKELLPALFELATNLRSQQKYSEAEYIYQRRLKIYSKTVKSPDIRIAMSMRSVALALELQKKYREAELFRRQDLDMRISLLGAKHLDVAASQTTLALNLEEQSKFTEAESLMRQALVTREHFLGSGHDEAMKTLAHLQRIEAKNGKSNETESIQGRLDEFEDRFPCQNILKLANERPGMIGLGSNGSTDMCLHAESVFQLSQCESKDGQYLSAERHLKVILECDMRTSGVSRTQVLAELGYISEQLGKYTFAEKVYINALDLSRAEHGSEHWEVAALLNELAGVVHEPGRYLEAEALHRQSLALRKRLFGAEHEQVAQSLTNLSGTLRALGKFSESEDLIQKALAIGRKNLGEEHPDFATIMEHYGSTLRDAGKLVEAERVYKTVVEIRRKALGREHPQVAIALDFLGQTLAKQGRLLDAEILLREALEISQRRLGPAHSAIATRLNNIALVLSDQGREEEAVQLLRRSLAITEKTLGTEHPEYATTLSNVALHLLHAGKKQDAETMYRKALTVRQRVFGKDHVAVAQNLNGLAHALSSQGRREEAMTLMRESLAILQKQRGKDHVEVATGMFSLAHMLLKQDQYGEAEALLRQSLSIRQRQLGVDHPLVARTEEALALTLFATQHTEEALALFAHSAKIDEKQVREAASESRMTQFLNQLRNGGAEDRLYSLALAGPQDAPTSRQLALTTELLRKGRAAEAGSVANTLLRRSLSNEGVRRQYDAWIGARQALEGLLFGGMGKLTAEQYRNRLQELRGQVESTEAQLLDDLPASRKQRLPEFDAMVSTVAQRLPTSGALVEFVFYVPALPGSVSLSQLKAEPHYLALLLFPDQRSAAVDLGPADAVNSQAGELLSKLQNPREDPKSAAQALYTLILRPLLPHLHGATELFLAPDHALHMIPFDALHDGKDYLLGRFRFHYLTSGRDLLRQPSGASGSSSLVVANPDFGKGDESKLQTQNQSLYSRLVGLAPLPGTLREAQAIGRLLGVEPLTGGHASEEAIRQVRSPRILHIATHGAFLEDVQYSPVSSDDQQGLRALTPLPQVRPKANLEHLPGSWGAMSRSALILAHAIEGSKSGSTEQDGLLTAQEARSLDLEATQMVVLSACETGQGSLSAGQGVYGLRRAFLVAGAETVVTSLWQVHDQTTGDLMTLFYRKLLDSRNPLGRLDAMRQAMRAVRGIPGRGHPYYWAPFLVIGQDGLVSPATKTTQPKVTMP